MDDDLLAPARYRDDVCHTAQALAELDDDDRPKAAAAARNKQVPVKRVIEYLTRKTGAAPKSQSLRRHRNGECSCD